MKKYLLAVLVLVLIAVGYAVSGKDNSSSKPATSTSDTEQAQEQAANKRKELGEEGYRVGYVAGFRYEAIDDPESEGRSYYDICWGTPVTDEEKELCEIFVEKYVEGYKEGYKDR